MKFYQAYPIVFSKEKKNQINRKVVSILLYVYIIKNGIILTSYNFSGDSILNKKNVLVSGFLSAIQSFTEECSGSVMESISCDKYVFHFYIDSNSSDLLYVFVSDDNYNKKKLNLKIQKIASLFYEKFSNEIKEFEGEVSLFDNFGEILSELNNGKNIFKVDQDFTELTGRFQNFMGNE